MATSGTGLAVLLTVALVSPRTVATNPLRGDGAAASAADPEAEAMWLKYPGDSFYTLPKIADLGGEVPWSEQISWEPRAQVYHNFLTPQECNHLINLAAPHMAGTSPIIHHSPRNYGLCATGKSMVSKVRTSTGHFLTRDEDAVVSRIEERIAAFAMIPADHGEGMQILHYTSGQKYEPHFDYFQDKENTKHGGQRVATVLLYLSDVEEGGETIFPKGKFVHGEPGRRQTAQFTRTAF